MGRCDGYYRLENRRCDREGEREARGADGDLYLVCGYHARQAWRTSVARWDGESGIRRSVPVSLHGPRPSQTLAWA